jgi:hypothetical protein
MSTKINRFNNDIIPLWNELQNFVSGIDESRISDGYIENFAYLRKITAFLSEAMSCIDADFLPEKVIKDIQASLFNIKANLGQTLNYNNIIYIRKVEIYLDELLQVIFPFILQKDKAIKGTLLSLKEYSETIANYVENKVGEIELFQKNASKVKSELENERSRSQMLRTEIEEYRDSIFSKRGIKDSIEHLLNNLKSESSEITKFNNLIYSEHGLKQKIDNFSSSISKDSKYINELKDRGMNTLQELEQFYDKIFGEDDLNGNKTGGLKQEIEKRTKDLEEFKKEQKKRYDELNKQIENLLPGATSAGLSSAYNEMRNKFSKSAKWYAGGFYVSLSILLVTILSIRDVVLVDKIPLDKGIWISLLVLLGNFAVKIPFIIPALWLVIFMSRRRSEAERLSQEYVHKEVLAKSYDSYKQQIEKLSKEDQKELLPVLMEGMIRAISLNPAETLDKKHQSDSPISEVLKDNKFIDSIADKIKSSSKS